MSQTPNTPGALDRHATRLVALLDIIGLTDSELRREVAHYDALPATRHVTAMERAVRAMATARHAPRAADSAR